jgi:hypothetical protein
VEALGDTNTSITTLCTMCCCLLAFDVAQVHMFCNMGF